MEDSRVDDLIRDLRSLQLQVTQLQEEARARENARRPEPAPALDAPERAVNGFARGDRVRVLNKFKKPATWNNSRQWSEAEARLATVTVVRPEQVFFTTDNGINTWRAPNNLRRL